MLRVELPLNAVNWPCTSTHGVGILFYTCNCSHIDIERKIDRALIRYDRACTLNQWQHTALHTLRSRACAAETFVSSANISFELEHSCKTKTDWIVRFAPLCSRRMSFIVT